MSRIPGIRLIRLFSTAVVDQVLLSAASFFVGLLLIRRTSAADYGLYVLVNSSINLLIAAQSAWVGGPMSAIAPRKSPDEKQRMIGAIDASQRRFVRIVAAAAIVVPIVGYALHLWSGLICAVIALSIPVGLTAVRRDFLRGALLIYARPHSMLIADCFYAGILISGVFVAVSGPRPPVLWAIGSLACASAVAALVARHSLHRDPGWIPGVATEFWQEMRPLAIWATVGALIYWLFSQSYNYLLVSRVSLKAVADVNAARLILMPTFVLTIGIKGLLGPSAAGWLAESGFGKLMRRLLIFTAGIAVLDFLYFGFAWTFRDWLSHDLMHKVIADRDELLILWAIVSLIGLLRDLLQSALFALHRFQALAWLSAVSAAVCITLMWFGIGWWGPAGTLIGQIVGELVNLAGILYMLASAHRNFRLHAKIPPEPV